MDYGAIKTELEDSKIVNPTIQDISKAVIAIRQSKLPDPKEIGNSGSFFKNPIISTKKFNKLQENFPDVPSYKISDKSQIEFPYSAISLMEPSAFLR